jgi:hypothetical protein
MAKLAKADVEYEHPAAKSNHCEICRHFLSPDTCRIVAGKVEPEDWCNRFKRSIYRHRRVR